MENLDFLFFRFYGEKDSDLVFKKRLGRPRRTRVWPKLRAGPRAIYSRMQEIYDFFCLSLSIQRFTEEKYTQERSPEKLKILVNFPEFSVAGVAVYNVSSGLRALRSARAPPAMSFCTAGESSIVRNLRFSPRRSFSPSLRAVPEHNHSTSTSTSTAPAQHQHSTSFAPA